MSRMYNIKTVETNMPELSVSLTDNEIDLIYQGLRYLVDEMVDNGEDTFQVDALFNKLAVVTA